MLALRLSCFEGGLACVLIRLGFYDGLFWFRVVEFTKGRELNVILCLQSPDKAVGQCGVRWVTAVSEPLKRFTPKSNPKPYLKGHTHLWALIWLYDLNLLYGQTGTCCKDGDKA